jgi:hypothetical protein
LCSFHAAHREKNDLFIGGGQHGVVGAELSLKLLIFAQNGIVNQKIEVVR